MRYSDFKIAETKVREYGPHDRVAKVGNTTVRANTRTGKQSVNTKVGDLELDADNTLNKDGSQGRMSATYTKDKLKLKHDTRKGMSASYKMPDGTTATASNSGKGKTKFKVSEDLIASLESAIKLNEGARIDHAEDIIFTEGSKGAIRALESLKQMEQGGHTNVTVKWDGSPALVFGRNEAGEFILTDKSGFVKKGGVERATSGDEIANHLLNRSGGANKEDPKRIAFATNMKQIFSQYDKATPKDFRGYLMGDLLYYNTPEVIDGKYTFTPNIVTYRVDVNSDLGKRIGQSKTGIVVHRLLDEQGNQSPVPQDLKMQGLEVMIFPSVTVSKPAQIEDEDINQLKAVVAGNAQAIDNMLDVNTLTQMQMKNLPTIFYTYLNSKVDTGLDNLGADFLQWIKTSKESGKKQQKIAEYVGQYKQAFDAMWKIVTGIMTIKNKIIDQFDSHDADVTAEIGSHGPVSQDAHTSGGEGYVLAHPGGDIKLVPRAGFTKANRSIQR